MNEHEEYFWHLIDDINKRHSTALRNFYEHMERLNAENKIMATYEKQWQDKGKN